MINLGNDYLYKFLGDLGYTGNLNDRWYDYLRDQGLQGTVNDMLYKLLVAFGFTGSVDDMWNKYIDSNNGIFTGFEKLRLDFTRGTLDPRITFSRTSNATITKSDGTIGYAPHNLLTHSEQFDNAAWTKSGSTVSANAIIAPNGTITADKIVETATTARHFIYPANFAFIAGTVYTISFYAKQAERNLIQISFSGSLSLSYANIDLSTGLQTAGTSDFVTITLDSNGFYKITCTITALNSLSTNPFSLDIITNSTVGRGLSSYAGDGTSGVYLWGAQLEIGSTATTYNPTTVKNLLGYTEAFDNAAWTKSNSFVQTNLLTYSEAFDNAAWTAANSTITTNTIIAPNGYQTAETVTLTSTSGDLVRRTSQSSISNAVPYTQSIYIKKGSFDWIRFVVADDTGQANSVRVWYNINTGAVGANTTTGTGFVYVSSVIQSVGDGWYRLSLTYTTSIAVSMMIFTSADTNGSLARAPNGSTYYIWGAQLVQGSVAGDYRRTDAAALPVFYPNHNGVVCAEKLVETAGTSAHRVFQGATFISGTPYTLSAYIKAGERRYCSLNIESNPFACNFDLQTGTITATAVGVTGTITPVGNGWYRCSVTKTSATAGAANNFICPILAPTGDNNYTGDGTSGIYIFGAQLSDSASLDPYVLNAAAAPSAQAYYGARFDYDPVTLQAKGLLIEEQRVNSLTYSEEFDNAAWSKSLATVSANTTISPSGQTNADSLIEIASTGFHSIYKTGLSFTSGQSYTLSCYAKPNGRNELTLVFDIGGTNTASAVFNVNTGVISVAASTTGSFSSASASITKSINGFYRISLTAIAPTGTATAGIELYNGARSYAGDGTSGSYLYGAQLEAGAFATSYIPTAASSVTRAADVAVIQGSNFYSWYNQNEGSSYVNADTYTITPTANAYVYAFTDGTANNNILTYINTSSASTGYLISYAGVTQAQMTKTPISVNTFFKQASSYKLNDASVSLNGGATSTDASVITPIISKLILGNNDTSTRPFNGHIKQLSYYNTDLPSATLQGLTA